MALFCFVMEGRLIPYARPRLSQHGGNVYSPTAQFKRDVQLLMSAQACRNKWVCLPTAVPVRVKIVYSVSTCHLRRGSHPAGDVDNLAKTVLSVSLLSCKAERAGKNTLLLRSLKDGKTLQADCLLEECPTPSTPTEPGTPLEPIAPGLTTHSGWSHLLKVRWCQVIETADGGTESEALMLHLKHDIGLLVKKIQPEQAPVELYEDAAVLMGLLALMTELAERSGQTYSLALDARWPSGTLLQNETALVCCLSRDAGTMPVLYLPRPRFLQQQGMAGDTLLRPQLRLLASSGEEDELEVFTDLVTKETHACALRPFVCSTLLEELGLSSSLVRSPEHSQEVHTLLRSLYPEEPPFQSAKKIYLTQKEEGWRWEREGRPIQLLETVLEGVDPLAVQSGALPLQLQELSLKHLPLEAYLMRMDAYMTQTVQTPPLLKQHSWLPLPARYRPYRKDDLMEVRSVRPQPPAQLLGFAWDCTPLVDRGSLTIWRAVPQVECPRPCLLVLDRGMGHLEVEALTHLHTLLGPSVPKLLGAEVETDRVRLCYQDCDYQTI